MSKIGNFFSNYSPVGQRMNRAKYVKHLFLSSFVLFMLIIIVVIILGVVYHWDRMAMEKAYVYFDIPFTALMMYIYLTLGFQRLHDFNYRGLWILFPFANLIICFIPGTKGPNGYGPDPLEKIKPTTINN